MAVLPLHNLTTSVVLWRFAVRSYMRLPLFPRFLPFLMAAGPVLYTRG